MAVIPRSPLVMIAALSLVDVAQLRIESRQEPVSAALVDLILHYFLLAANAFVFLVYFAIFDVCLHLPRATLT